MLLDELNAQYGELLYHNEVHWLSRGAVLNRFFHLFQEIALLTDLTEYNGTPQQPERETGRP